MHRKKYPDLEEFWNSDTPSEFRVNSTNFAQYLKFKLWVLQELENKKDEQDFHEEAIKNFREMEFYDDYDKNYEIPEVESILKFSKADFYKNIKGWKPKGEIDLPLKPDKKLADEYEFDYISRS